MSKIEIIEAVLRDYMPMASTEATREIGERILAGLNSAKTQKRNYGVPEATSAHH